MTTFTYIVHFGLFQHSLKVLLLDYSFSCKVVALTVVGRRWCLLTSSLFLSICPRHFQLNALKCSKDIGDTSFRHPVCTYYVLIYFNIRRTNLKSFISLRVTFLETQSQTCPLPIKNHFGRHIKIS